MRLNRSEYLKQWRARNHSSVQAYKHDNPKPPTTVIGIDGEGITVKGRHLYTYLAAWSEDECISVSENEAGITPRQAFEFLFAVKAYKPHSLLAGFSLGYDYTKFFEGLPTRVVYLLARPELRRGKNKPRPIRWEGYSLNYLRGCFTITRLIPGEHTEYCDGTYRQKPCQGCAKGESVSVWDVWGFFQGSFIDACLNWGVIDEKEYEYLKAMKLRRPEFTMADWPEVKAYCGVECQRLASMVTRLRQAHEEAGIPLRSYYGAGSTAAGILSKNGIKTYMPKGELPAGLLDAIARAFFGGRFEPSRVGPVRRPIHSWDIASAYPYQLYQLPCLACGTWEHVSGRGLAKAIERARFGLVRYALPYCNAVSVDRAASTSPEPWGPFPMRTGPLEGVGPLGMGIDAGNIVYPVTSGGGWAYLDEYRTGAKHWPNVVPKEAWLYHTECGHTPFHFIPELYRQRLAWGKEGRGIVVKLGANSIYGKLAQSIGDAPPFQCFLWAGMITSGTRAQLLELIAQGRESVLMTATDGVIGTRALKLPLPIDTGTLDAARAKGKEPLGAWEYKSIPDGMMLIRAGIAFPLSGEIEKECKARGIGKAVLKSSRADVLTSWDKYGPKTITVHGSIFHGFKSATGVDAHGYKRADNYGQWSDRETQVSYMPEPKRPFAMTEDGRLCTWAFGPKVVSEPYSRILSKDAAMMVAKKLIESEQPDREDREDEF